MFNRKLIAVLALLLLALFLAGTSLVSAGGDNFTPVNPIVYRPASPAPLCQVVDDPSSEYYVSCVDDNISAIKVKEVGIRCVAGWDETSAFIKVPVKRLDPTKILAQGSTSPKYLFWKVFDADGNVTSGIYLRH